VTLDPAKPAIGFIGLGGEGLAMATAIAGAGYPLHVQARPAVSLDALGDVAHVRHDSTSDRAAACEIVGLFSTDEDVMQVVAGGLLGGLRRRRWWSITVPARRVTPSRSQKRARPPASRCSTPPSPAGGPPPKHTR
jgi:hypothetical protein